MLELLAHSLLARHSVVQLLQTDAGAFYILERGLVGSKLILNIVLIQAFVPVRLLLINHVRHLVMVLKPVSFQLLHLF